MSKLQERYEAAVADLGFRDGSLEAQLLWDYTLAVKELLADQSAPTEAELDYFEEMRRGPCDHDCISCVLTDGHAGDCQPAAPRSVDQKPQEQ